MHVSHLGRMAIAAAGITGLVAAAEADVDVAGDGPTPVTFNVTSGPLAVTAPGSASVAGPVTASSGAPLRLSGDLGSVTAADQRGQPAGDWTATVTIERPARPGPAAAGDIRYLPGSWNGTPADGISEDTGHSPGGALVAFRATGAPGASSVTWHPVVRVSLPPGTVAAPGSVLTVVTVSVA